MKQSIGEFLANLRKARGLTQQEVADSLDVSNRTVSSWERGTNMPDILLLPTLAELYGVTTDELLAGERNENNSAAGDREQINQANITLARFTMWIIILASAFAVFYTLFFTGWYCHARVCYLRGTHLFEWRWQIMLYGGLTLSVITAVTIFALWRRCESSVAGDKMYIRQYRTQLKKRMAYCCFAAALMSAVFAIVTIFPLQQKANALHNIPANGSGSAFELYGWMEQEVTAQLYQYIGMLVVFALLAIVMGVVGLVLWKRTRSSR